jgi:hypothetical protein
LQNIQRIWEKGGAKLHRHLITNIIAIMKYVLTPLAKILLVQRLNTNPDFAAAPCFNYYPLDDNGDPLPPLKSEKLHSDIVKLVGDARGIAPDEHKPSLEQIAYEAEKLTPTFDRYRDIDYYEIYPPIAVARVGSA